MVNAGEIYGNGLKLSAYLAEGIFTRRDVTRDDGALAKGGTFSSKISKGDLVQIWTNSWSGSDTIVTGAYTDSIDPTLSFAGSLGIVITEPEGKVPDVASDGGTYTATAQKNLRRASILFPGFSVVHRGKVVSASKAGAYLGYDQSGGGFTTTSADVAYKPFVLLQSASAGGTYSIAMGGGG